MFGSNGQPFSNPYPFHRFLSDNPAFDSYLGFPSLEPQHEDPYTWPPSRYAVPMSSFLIHPTFQWNQCATELPTRRDDLPETFDFNDFETSMNHAPASKGVPPAEPVYCDQAEFYIIPPDLPPCSKCGQVPLGQPSPILVSVRVTSAAQVVAHTGLRSGPSQSAPVPSPPPKLARKPKLFTAASVASTEDASTTSDPVEPQPPVVLAPAPTETAEKLTPGKSTYRATAQKRARTLALDKQRKALEAAHPIVTAPAWNPDVDDDSIRVSRPLANSTACRPPDATQTMLVEGPSSAQKHAHVATRDKQQKAPEAPHPASVPSTSMPENDAIDIDQPPVVAPVKRKRNWATASPASSNETGAPPVQPVAKRSKTSAAVRPMFSGLALPTPLPPPVTATPHSLRSPSLFTAHSPDLTSPPPAETAVSLDHRPTVVSQQGTTKRMSTSPGKKKGKRKLVDLAAEGAAKDRLIAKLHEQLAQSEKEMTALETARARLQEEIDAKRLIPRPSGRRGVDWNLQTAMGLANDKKQYNVLMASCRDCFYRANMDIWKTLNQQEPGKVPAAINAARTIPGNEILSTFENDWATREFFMQTMREKRKQFKAAERREALAAIMRGSVPTITQNAQRATAGLAGQTNGPVHPEVGKAHGVRPSQNDDDSDHEDDEHEQPPSEDESNAESGTESSEYE